MKINFALWILMGVVAGITLGVLVKNIVAGVSCCCAIRNLPVLFAKRKPSARCTHKKETLSITNE
jgi:hypothetical protein